MTQAALTLQPNLIALGAALASKDAAIAQVAQLLADAGKIDISYLAGMRERESQANTYLGNDIAIPHGVPELRHLIHETAIAVLQIPAGIPWGEDGETVKLAIGIAAKGDEHLNILRKLTGVLGDEELVAQLSQTQNKADIIRALTGQEMAAESSGQGALPYQTTVILPNPMGMHARPATALAQLVKSRGGTVTLRAGGKSADATKMMQLLSMGLKQGSEITVLADSQATLDAVRDGILSGLGDDLSAPKAKAAPLSRQPEWTPAASGTALEGVGASGGLVVGVTQRHQGGELQVQDTAGDVLEESERLDRAIHAASQELQRLSAEMKAKFGAERAAIFEAHQELLSDPDTLQDAAALILDGHGAAWSYRAATQRRIEQLKKLDDPNLAARAVDLSDVQQRVLRALLGVQEQTFSAQSPVILLAHDLTPSDTARLDPQAILGFVTAAGGPTSHTAIIARGLGLPAVVAAGDGIFDIPDGTPCILDGSGWLYLNPSQAAIDAASERMQALQLADQEACAQRHAPARTPDGHTVEIAANINRAADAPSALEAGADGVGLMRTEFLFLERSAAPSEDEQYREYLAMAQALGDKPLIIRTLDIGGDKEVGYLGLAKEDNSFLGIRGIRLCFERPDLFLPQLRAIYRAAKERGNIKIMFPMIATLEDFRRARDMAMRVQAELGAPEVPLGIMIEVPSAAVMAGEFAAEVDFFSIGTNDLTSYTLAMDRLHPTLARQADAMHPAVLRLIAATVHAANQQGKWVGVCGGAAGEDLGALLLSGIGVQELSVAAPLIPGVKAALRGYRYADLQALAQRALACATAAEVRALPLPPRTEG